MRVRNNLGNLHVFLESEKTHDIDSKCENIKAYKENNDEVQTMGKTNFLVNELFTIFTESQIYQLITFFNNKIDFSIIK